VLKELQAKVSLVRPIASGPIRDSSSAVDADADRLAVFINQDSNADPSTLNELIPRAMVKGSIKALRALHTDQWLVILQKASKPETAAGNVSVC